MLFIMLLVLCLISAIFNSFWNSKHSKSDFYLGIDSECRTMFIAYIKYEIMFFFVSDVASKNFGYNLLTFIILYNNLIPISLQVTLELVRFLQVNLKHNLVIYPNTNMFLFRPSLLTTMLKCTTKSPTPRLWLAHRI